MRNSHGYVTIAIGIVVVAAIFVTFSDEDSFDCTGIAYDIDQTSSGFTFFLQTSSGMHQRCFSYTEPVYLGYYGLNGSLSEDGSIFFVSKMINLDDGDP